MSPRYDLHTHSTASDGTLSPTALVKRAAAHNVTTLALTDHDTLSGINEAKAAATVVGINFIAGVEISATWGGRTIHIIGLGVDIQSTSLCLGLQQLLTYRQWRASEIAKRLASAGISDALTGATAFAHGSLIGRTHFARFLVERGYGDTVRTIFKHFLVKGKPGYVASQWANLTEVTQWIVDAGGQAVIAHPARYDLTRSKLFRLINEFKAAGGIGMEVVSGSHTSNDVLVYGDYSRDSGLLASVGSDYHGPETPWRELGSLPDLPKNCVPIWSIWN